MCKFVNNTKHSRIDRCIRNLIDILKARGVKVVACCCGHNKYPLSILILQGLETDPYVLEIISGISIPRKRNFYKKDKQGYYYIPEVKQSEGKFFSSQLGIRKTRFI